MTTTRKKNVVNPSRRSGVAGRVKIGDSFYQSGYGRGLKNAAIYLIDGYCYARSLSNWKTDFEPLKGELKGYVRVNASNDGPNPFFSQANAADNPLHPHRPYKGGSKTNPSRMAKAAISAFDTDYDLDLDLKDVARLKRGEKKLAARKAAVRKTPAAKRKNPLDPLIAVTTGLSGIMSALTIKKMLAEDEKKKVMRRKTTTRQKTNGKTTAKPRTAAKRNSSLFPSGEAHTMTMKFANGKVRSVYVIDSKSGKPLAKHKSLAGAKRYAAANGIRLEVNPAKKAVSSRTKTNGIFSKIRHPFQKEFFYKLTFMGELDSIEGRTMAKNAAEAKRKLRAEYRGDPRISQIVSIKVGLNRKNPRPAGRVVIKTVARKPVVKKAVARSNPKVKVPARRTFKMFQGRDASTARKMNVSRHAPARMDQLGDLIELKLADGQLIKPNPKSFKLCAAGGKLWIAGGRFAKANPAGKANELNPVEKIVHVVYGTYKPHHGDHKYTHYIHKLGEESGHMPTLAVDREGFPVIRGGKYKIEARGIVN